MKKKHLKVLQEIQESIPKELLLSLTKKEKQFATIKEIMVRALTEPDEVVSPDKKRRFRELIAAGHLDREVEVLDQSVEAQIDAIYTKEIARAVEDGRLPKNAPKIRLKNNKGKQYARRQAARIKSIIADECGKDTIHPGVQA